jgi:ankyrin repeat protein
MKARDQGLDGLSPLTRAAEAGDLRAVRVLLHGGADPLAGDDQGWTALHAAAARRHPTVVRALLKWGVPADLVDFEGVTPLWNASGPGDAKSARLLLDGGADPCHRDSGVGDRPLDRAAEWDNLPVARLLIAAGADPDGHKDDGSTPLMAAAEAGAIRTARLLLSAGADPSAVLPPWNVDAGMSAADLARRMSDGRTLPVWQRRKLRKMVHLIERWPKSIGRESSGGTGASPRS